MTLRQLEVFLAVAREKSFSRAAKKIHSSQPTLSEHVIELEGELGKVLFYRRGKEVTMTEAGRVFERYAAGVVSSVEEARQAVAELDGLAHGSLLIGASTTPGLYVMPSIVAAFRTRYPGVDLKLQIANSQVIEQRVRERELDLGIVGGHSVSPGQECLAAGMLDELVLIVPPGHEWARRRNIVPEALADEPLLMREAGSATRSVTERALQRAGVKFRVAMELDHTEAIKQGVMAVWALRLPRFMRSAVKRLPGGSARSNSAAFGFNDTFMSCTMNREGSRRARAPSWSSSSTRHAGGRTHGDSRRRHHSSVVRQ